MKSDVIALCETKRPQSKRQKKDEIPGYEVIERNVKYGKEGLMIAVRNGTFRSVEEVTQCELQNILTVRIRYLKDTARVILAHAPQETDPLEERTDFFEELAVQVERCVTAGDKMVLLGDLNARVVYEDGEVKPAANSPNGKLLHALVDSHNLCLANFSPNTKGKYTRIQKTKKGINKSAIDYILLEQHQSSLMEEMIIDEEKIYCPYRERKTKDGKTIVFSDHCTILMKLQIKAGGKSNFPSTQKVWNFSEEGYRSYKNISRQPMEIVFDTDVTRTYSNWKTKFEELLHSCFTKKTIKTGVKNEERSNKKNRCVRKILSELSKKGKLQRKIALQYLLRVIEIETRQLAQIKTMRLKQTMSILTEEEKFSPNGYWRMKQAADKNLKNDTICTVLKENGVEVTGPSSIKDAYLEEFKHRLRTRTPREGWEQYVADTNRTIRQWLEGCTETSPPFITEELDKVIAKLKKGKKPGIDEYPTELFIHAGGGVRTALLALFNFIKATRKIPEQWDFVQIITIYKKKGCKKMLRYYRGIFLAITISKIFEALIKLRIEHNLNRINILQAGSRKERGPPDNVFLMRGCIDHYVAIKKPLYITAYDYEQAFDSLWVEKCIQSLKNLGVSKEMLQLIYNLNKRAKVIVKTPYGMTDVFETEPVVKQGTVLGSALCSSSTAEYCGVNKGVTIGTMDLSSLLYVDDVIDLSETLFDREESHRQALVFSWQNNLSLSGTKCYGMGINCETPLPTLLIEIDGSKFVIPAEAIIYLGDPFNQKGNNDDLIDDRIRRGTKASICISSLIYETNLGIYELSVWLLLYQCLFLSTVLFNCQTWSKLRVKDIERLEIMQQKFVKKMVGVCSGIPNSFLFLELGILPIEAEIHKRQLMFLHRILTLPVDDPVHQMFLNIMVFDLKGEANWWSQVKTLLPKYNLPICLKEIKELKKDTFKKMISKAVQKVVVDKLIIECTSLQKTKSLCYTSLEMQGYLKVLFPNQARIILKSRCGGLDIKTHNSFKFEAEDTTCRKCGVEDETFDHVINCGIEKEEHIEIDVNNMKDYSDSFIATLMKVTTRIGSFCDLPSTSEASHLDSR